MTAFRYGLVAIFLLSQSVIGAAKAEQGTDQAPDVVVLCDPSLHETLVAAGRAWQAKSRVPVRVLTASLEQNGQLIVHGARADILVGVGVQRIDEAQKLGAIGREPPIVIGHNPIVLVVHGGVAERRQLALGDDIGGLLGDGRLGLVDPAFGSAGPDARTALAAIGLWPGLEPRSLGAETTNGLKQLLNDGSVRLVAFYNTDLAGGSGLSVAATFPTLSQPVAAALTKDAQSPNAKGFLSFLAGEGQSILKQNGMEAP